MSTNSNPIIGEVIHVERMAHASSLLTIRLNEKGKELVAELGLERLVTVVNFTERENILLRMAAEEQTV